jgi:4-hydroxy-tetrahydrodipicolinate synthase
MSLNRRAFLATAASVAWAAPNKTDAVAGNKFQVAALTMLDSHGNPDEMMAKDYLAYLRKNGVEGMLVLGSNGEFASFSVAERKRVLESYIRHKGNLYVTSHVGTPNLPETLDLLAHATAAGADSALVVPPFYYKNVSVEGLVEYYSPILRAARLPVFLYNIPQNSGVAITFELLRRLSSFERLAGVKDSFSKAEVIQATIREFPKLKIFAGNPGNTEANLSAGGAGIISGPGSVVPRETAAIFEAFRNHGDVHAAQLRHDEAASWIKGYDAIPAMKFALSRVGLRESACRAPFVALTADQRRELTAKMPRVG